MKMVNLETIADTQSRYKISTLNGYNLNRAKLKLPRRRTGVYESFSSRRQSLTSFIQTIRWNLANPVKLPHGIIVHQRSIDPRQMYCWKSGTKKKKRDICCTVTIRLGWRMVDWICGMPPLSVKCPRRVRKPCSKTQCKGSDNDETWWTCFIFPVADGTVTLSGRDHEIPKSTFLRDQPVPNEELGGDLQGSSDESQPIDETKDGAEARNDFWSIEKDYIYRRHVEPRVQYHVPKEQTFAIPLKTHWRDQDCTSKAGRVARKPNWRLLEHWCE